MSYAVQGFGDDSGDPGCTGGSTWDPNNQACYCPSDSISVDGVCKDPSTMCGPGTQWVDSDNACVPLTKYMAPAQIAAATKAGVNLTGSATPPVVVTARAPAASTPVAPSPFAKLASLFGGGTTPWIVGGIAVGVVGLALMARSNDRGSRYEYR